jgi:hypothetical protein
MKMETDGLREALFAQMRVPPLPEYSGDTVILRAYKMPTEVSASRPTIADSQAWLDGESQKTGPQSG